MIDFGPWDEMLTAYVKDGTVNYARWQMESVELLRQWLKEASSVNVERVDDQSAIAFLLNLYNALTIEQVLQKYPIDTIRPKILGVPNWPSFLAFFKKDIYSLNGRSVSLDNIEHDILRARYSEPRIHFALVCASTGCPLIRSGAYLPEKLETQLEEDVSRFINNPEKVKYDAASQTLYCSKIFDWYEKDFLTQAASIPDYIGRYLRSAKLSANPKVEYLPYDWSLNQRTSS